MDTSQPPKPPVETQDFASQLASLADILKKQFTGKRIVIREDRIQIFIFEKMSDATKKDPTGKIIWEILGYIKRQQKFKNLNIYAGFRSITIKEALQ